MALVNTKIKYHDEEPDCTRAFRLARIKGKKKNKPAPEHPRDIPFQDLTVKATYSSQHCRNVWWAGVQAGVGEGPDF